MSSIPFLTAGGAAQWAEVGIQRGVAGLDRDAASIANVSAGIQPEPDLTEALVDQSRQKLYVEAAAKALSIAESTTEGVLGRLVDTHA